MPDGHRATIQELVQADYEEVGVEPVSYEHYIPIEELEQGPIQLPEVEEDPDTPF
jgi:hypothetical protein